MTQPPMSPAPGTPQTPTKAVLAAVTGFVGTFVFSLWTAVQGHEDIDSLKASQWWVIILGALATTIAAGGLTYQIPNKASKVQTVPPETRTRPGE